MRFKRIKTGAALFLVLIMAAGCGKEKNSSTNGERTTATIVATGEQRTDETAVPTTEAQTELTTAATSEVTTAATTAEATTEATTAATTDATTAEATSEASTSTETALSAADISDKLEDLEYIIDNEIYAIPFSVDEMPDDYKYVPASNGEAITEVDAGSTVKMKFKCDRFDNDFVMECSLNNPEEEAIPYDECDIVSVSYGISGSSKYPELILPKGIKWGSSKDDIVAAYGDPSNVFGEDYGMPTLEYSAGGKTVQFITTPDGGLEVFTIY